MLARRLLAATLAHNLLRWIAAMGWAPVRSWWWPRRCAAPCWVDGGDRLVDREHKPQVGGNSSVS
jgi:hypothetical protein